MKYNNLDNIYIVHKTEQYTHNANTKDNQQYLFLKKSTKDVYVSYTAVLMVKIKYTTMEKIKILNKMFNTKTKENTNNVPKITSQKNINNIKMEVNKPNINLNDTDPGKSILSVLIAILVLFSVMYLTLGPTPVKPQLGIENYDHNAYGDEYSEAYKKIKLTHKEKVSLQKLSRQIQKNNAKIKNVVARIKSNNKKIALLTKKAKKGNRIAKKLINKINNENIILKKTVSVLLKKDKHIKKYAEQYLKKRKKANRSLAREDNTENLSTLYSYASVNFIDTDSSTTTLPKPIEQINKSNNIDLDNQQDDDATDKYIGTVIEKNKPYQKQTTTDTKKIASKLLDLPIAVGFYFSPEVTSRSIHFSGEENPETVQQKQNNKEKLGYSAGLSVELPLPNNFYLRTGINYSNVADRNNTLVSNKDTDTAYSMATQQVHVSNLSSNQLTTSANIADKGKIVNDNESQTAESLSKSHKTVSNHYHYIGIPVLVGMKLSRSRLSAGVYSGLLTNFLVSPNTSLYTVYDDPNNPEKHTEAQRELSKVTLSYWGGIDVDLKLSDEWSLNLSPTIKYSLTSLYKDSETPMQFPYTFGLQFGCKYKL